MRTEFSSPWSNGLKAMTAIALGALGYFALHAEDQPKTFAGIALAIFICGSFAVRGYRIVGNDLVIKRVGWSSRFALSVIESVEVAPDAMSGSLRVFGIGGLFSYVGLFRNERLGWYRCYATDPANAVVIRFPTRRIVVTPDDPRAFADAATAAHASV